MTQRQDDPLAELEWRLPSPPCERVGKAIRRECTASLCKKQGASRMRRLFGSVALFGGTIVILAFLGITRDGMIADGVRAALYGAAGWGAVLSAILFAFAGIGLVAGPLASRGTALGDAVPIKS